MTLEQIKEQCMTLEQLLNVSNYQINMVLYKGDALTELEDDEFITLGIVVILLHDAEVKSHFNDIVNYIGIDDKGNMIVRIY